MARVKRQVPSLSGVPTKTRVRWMICAVVTALLAYTAFAGAVASSIRLTQPEIALRFGPNNADALAAQANQNFISAGQVSPETEALARKSLDRQAINPIALRIVAFAAEQKSQCGMCLMRLAERLSRRDLTGQLWLVEHAVGAGDVRGALAHYDIALRTNEEVTPVLFPRLLDALTEPEVRLAFRPYFKTNPNWLYGFLDAGIGNDQTVPTVARLFVENGGFPHDASFRQLELLMVNRLVASGQFNDARAVYAKMPGANPAKLLSATVSQSDAEGRGGAIDWQVYSTAGATGEFVRMDNGSMGFHAYAGSGERASVARKALFLSPGAYRLQARFTHMQIGANGSVGLALRCAAPGNQALIGATSGAGPQAAIMQVPANCPFQFLDIVISGGDDRQGSESDISQIAVVRQ